jgi:Tfp pilus assembly ATPase PilU
MRKPLVWLKPDKLAKVRVRTAGSLAIGTACSFGEIRGGEAFDLLQLLNTGHSGTISTVHASSTAQGISRFSTCVLQSGVETP